MRIVLIGNAGGGKSTLARKLAVELGVPSHEIDRLLWRSGWALAPIDEYEADHADLLAGERWIIEGLGRRESIPVRFERATHVVLCDFPLWQHFWLLAERQIAWSQGDLEHPPGGVGHMPPTKALFETVWAVERDWMPMVRELTDQAERDGRDVRRIGTFDQLESFSWASE